jgi:hypothetical protein
MSEEEKYDPFSGESALQYHGSTGESLRNSTSVDEMPSLEAKDIKLPRAHGGGLTLKEKRYVQGSIQSIRRLKQNNFDPIDELVFKYRKLEDELERFEKWRDGYIVPLNSKGTPIAYTGHVAQAHLSIFDRLVKISETLLRYAYGRVPEGLNLQGLNTRPLTINLSKDQESYELIVNEQGFEDDD